LIDDADVEKKILWNAKHTEKPEESCMQEVM
jgi:hypothetical protein